MYSTERNYPSPLTHVNAELGLSQEGVAIEVCASWASLNLWGIDHAKQTKIAQEQLEGYLPGICDRENSFWLNIRSEVKRWRWHLKTSTPQD